MFKLDKCGGGGWEAYGLSLGGAVSGQRGGRCAGWDYTLLYIVIQVSQVMKTLCRNGLKGQKALSPGHRPGLGAYWPYRPSLRNLRKLNIVIGCSIGACPYNIPSPLGGCCAWGAFTGAMPLPGRLVLTIVFRRPSGAFGDYIMSGFIVCENEYNDWRQALITELASSE